MFAPEEIRFGERVFVYEKNGYSAGSGYICADALFGGW